MQTKMLRQASSRNQRSKGFKVKHALQICLLVAICIWLLYQVKHSHEKKRAFEERNSRILNKIAENQADAFKLGRKDLPHIEETIAVNDTQNKEDDSEDTQEEDEEEEHDTKQEENDDDEGRDAVEDDIDEHDQDRGDEETEHEEEPTEEEENINHEEKDSGDEVDLFDNQEHEGVSQEAREENYKRDDASSAVVQDTHETESAKGTEGTNSEGQVDDRTNDNSSSDGTKHNEQSSADGAKGEGVADDSERKVVESENVNRGTEDGSQGNHNSTAESISVSVNNTSDPVSETSETLQAHNLSSVTEASDSKDIEVHNQDMEFSKPDNKSVAISTTVEYNNQTEQQNNLTILAESLTQMELHSNSTEGIFDHPTEVQGNSIAAASNDTASFDSAQNQNTSADGLTQSEEVHNSQNVVVEQAAVQEDPHTVEHTSTKERSTTSTDENEGATEEHPNTSVTDEHRGATDEHRGATEEHPDSLVTNEEGGATEEHPDTSVTGEQGGATEEHSTTSDTSENGGASVTGGTTEEHPDTSVTGEQGVATEEHSTTTDTSENGRAAQGESDNSSHAVITEEERDARTDLSTLPNIQNEVKTTYDEAAE